MYHLLKCPNCNSQLEKKNNYLLCNTCKKNIPCTAKGIPIFVKNYTQNEVKSHNTKKTFFKSIIKRLQAPHHSIYNNLKSSHSESKELLKILKSTPEKAVILNIGSLSKNLESIHKGIINLDISYYKNIDLIADACDLPFKDDSIDIIILKNVLEHIKTPTKALNEIYRVLKKDGILYIKIPFLQPFHAVPNDFQRYTYNGIKELFQNYEELDFGISVGGGSMLAWIIREYLAVLTSFGNSNVYKFGIIFWGWLTFWIKYTDLLLKKNPFVKNIASAFYGVYKK